MFTHTSEDGKITVEELSNCWRITARNFVAYGRMQGMVEDWYSLRPKTADQSAMEAFRLPTGDIDGKRLAKSMDDFTAIWIEWMVIKPATDPSILLGRLADEANYRAMIDSEEFQAAEDRAYEDLVYAEERHFTEG